eukprot:TRINITY_DN4702_c0_g1_i1.p1 TRINITY_DN4702_c0_g1~~TRINITY_DN4702_c0_g1_i1.p1  ORF type:complete len:157 (-),score=15.29 TRINITY_DN4702_c0_g1_i1:531-1001(-)
MSACFFIFYFDFISLPCENMGRSAKQVADSVVSSELSAAYTKEWERFQEDQGFRGTPKEVHFANYFKNRRDDDNLKGSTLWCSYSKLNRIMKLRYGRRLQEWPRLTHMLKTYKKSEEPTKAPTFTHEEVVRFIRKRLGTPRHSRTKLCAPSCTPGG